MGVNNTGNNYYNSLNKQFKPQIPWWKSWAAVIIAFIIFWPIGAVLLWRKIATDKRAEMLMGRVVQIIGWFFAAFAALGTSVSISEGTFLEDIGVIIFLLGAGAVLILFGRRMKANAVKFKKYISIVGNQHIHQIDNIAAAVGFSADRVKSDLQKMINKGYFTGAYIDETNREIIMPQQNTSVYQENNNVNNTANDAGIIVVTCKSCGANNTIVKGTAGECEYCGSPIA